jgi:thiol-disulfide isomerase/thioredoxin
VIARRTFLRMAAVCAPLQALPRATHAAEIVRWPTRQAPVPLDAVDLSGRSWNLPALRGRGVLLNFWASWCEPCRAEMPTLQQLADFYGDDRLAVLALNFKEAPAVAARFAARTQLKLPILMDPSGEMARRWQVKVFPTTILIGADGRPRWRVRGEMDWTSQEAGRLVEGLFS